MYSFVALFLVRDLLLPRIVIIGSNIVIIKLNSFIKAYLALKSRIEGKKLSCF